MRYPHLFCPPLVELSARQAGLLLAWEKHERDGSWWAIVTYIRRHDTGLARHTRTVVTVRGDTIRPLEMPDTYRDVPRWLRRIDGTVERIPPEQ